MDIQDMKILTPNFLDKAKKRGYICPNPDCRNGAGDHGTGIEPHGDPPRYHCFKCGFDGDVIDLFGVAYGIDDDKEKFKEFRKHYGIKNDDLSKARVTRGKDIRNMKDNESKKNEIKEAETNENGLKDHTDYYKKCVERNDGEYLKNRGINMETQKHFMIGYDPEWRASEKAPATPRVIIPRSRDSYLARDVRSDVPEDQKQYIKMNNGKVELFGTKMLNKIGSGQPVFITEGEIDAMSIHEAGGYAVALCSTSNIDKLIALLTELKPNNPTFLLMLDNDGAGEKAQADLSKKLCDLGYTCQNVTYDGKDPNEALMNNRDKFVALIAAERDRVLSPFPSAHERMKEFNIECQKQGFTAKTGFAMFDIVDNYFYGGLHVGLYILGAVSNEGKSTFILQLANQMAERGIPVLFFTTEQDAYELMAKDISRETFRSAGTKKITIRDGKEIFLARNYYQVTDVSRQSHFTDEERDVLDKARTRYENYNNNLIFIDRETVIQYTKDTETPEKQLSARTLERMVNEYITKTGKKPVVFVDYIQNMWPADIRMSDKQNTDNTVYALKALSTLQRIPVFAVSSFNRENYSEPISMTSFKESGAIEYSADCLLGLQQAGMDYMEGETAGSGERKKRVFQLRQSNNDKKRNMLPVDMELKCLKQRNGMPFTMSLKFYGAFNYFSDEGDVDFTAIPADERTPYDAPAEEYDQAELDFERY